MNNPENKNETTPVLDLTSALIARRSVTPDDAGCQELIAARLKTAGMTIEHLPSGPVRNLLATHGTGRPHLLLLGHTDVVPPGPEAAWTSPPFFPEVRDGALYGRGAADMKSGVAAFVIALERFIAAHPGHAGTVSLLLTSDEEGDAEHGVTTVVPVLHKRDLLPDFVIVGEPSGRERLGDRVRIGRRGSIQARLIVRGIQGHTAYTTGSENPVHRAAPLLAALTALEFDDADEHFPATILQISNLRAGTGADNVTPGELEIMFNLRHHPATTMETLETRIRALIGEHDPGDWTLEWWSGGAPYGPSTGPLQDAAIAVCREILDITPQADTGGGTSDGRFFGPLGIPVVELGPVNRSIHRIDEHVCVADLERLPAVYLRIMERLLVSS